MNQSFPSKLAYVLLLACTSFSFNAAAQNTADTAASQPVTAVDTLAAVASVNTSYISDVPDVEQADFGHLSGDIMINGNFFQRDPSIGASDNPLYDNLLSGTESWMSLRYQYGTFSAFLRVDAFANSNLRNPLVGMTGFGIGAFSLSKEFNKLSVTAGYVYDQIGTGIIFRAYEDRGLLIDNAVIGMHLKYQLTPDISVKAFGGQQKNALDRFMPIIKGAAMDGNFNIKDKVFLAPGIGVVNRTLDQGSMDNIINAINALPLEERFVPQYNTYAFTAFNNLSIGNISWDIEAAYKTEEAINDYDGKLMNKEGTVIFSSINYARRGISLNVMGKRTHNFVLRTSPSETSPNAGMINWQPIMAQIRPQRLISRYVPASQDLSEQSFSANMDFMPKDGYNFNLSYTHINTVEGLKLYREALFETNIRSLPKTNIDIGLHYMHYNQDYYQFKPGVPMLIAFTPYTEITQRLTNLYSLKFQAQYMDTKQDFGSWLFGSLEFSMASRFAIAVSDMWNIKPVMSSEKKHYYNVFASYINGAHRFSVAWVKQVEGINCTGGVCRYEPAFNGLKINVVSSF